MDYKSRILAAVNRYEKKREKDRVNGDEPEPEPVKKRKTRSKDPEEWTEAQTQRAIANVLDRLNICWCHVPNEGKRNKIAGNMLRASGLKSGVPDILIFSPAPNKPQAKGTAIELKRTKGGKVSDNQKKWLEKLDKCGWHTAVCRGYGETIRELEKLGFLKKQGKENG